MRPPSNIYFHTFSSCVQTIIEGSMLHILWGCSIGATLSIIMDFFRSNVYEVGKDRLLFPGLSNMFDI